MIIREFADDWITALEESETLAPQTIQTMRSNLNAHILPEFGDLEVDVVDARILNEWAKSSDLQPASKRRILATIRTLLHSAGIDVGEVKLPRAQHPSRVQAPSWSLIMDAAENAGSPAQEEIALLALTGLRISEALALRWTDVESGGPLTPTGEQPPTTIKVERSLMRDGRLAPTKNRRSRVVYLTRAAEAWLQRMADEGYQGVFCTGRTGLRRCLEPYGLHPHALRHYYASHMLENGASIAFVSEQMGHANPGITLSVYAHFIGDPRREIARVNENVQ